ncbi:T9SS type A sorting domain-containing protein [Polaribacter septentrionalilitoris]|uniref:T9SS type A sorting domain-containing protein n=1 Tax=Polaribacter septentrionalilitoris TaxID=2494657 RepID=UPI0013581C96|nr:T9SS type A sorting domain-containing protein [Polaribacter septentrionalilitoris]
MKKNQKLNRRDFIKLSSIASASLPFTLSGFPLFANDKPKDYNFSEDNENVLVLIQLQGGNDGLNTIFNLNQYDNLQAVRSNIIIPEKDLLTVDGATRFHPNMAGIKQVWNKEKLAIIQNVGYPNQNRSHFRSTDIWNSASDAEEYISSGWIGRFFNENHPQFPENYPNENETDPFAITIGRIISETCQGPVSNFSMALEDPDNPGTATVTSNGEVPENCYGDALQFVNDTISQTNAYADIIKKASSSGNNLSEKYTDSDLAEKLKNVAKLISGGLKTKVYIVQLGGFDTHDNQVLEGDKKTGRHGILLQELSDAIEAFQDDIELLGIDNKVIGMTYSEFGRRIRSNGGLGTDHGSAAPLFLFGSCANNTILGDAPEIDTQVGIKEGVQMQYDFRNIYSTILTDWLGATKQEATSILFDDFDALPIFKSGCSASLSTNNFGIQELEIDIYPNPTVNSINITFFGNNENVKITLYNAIGAVVKQITNKKFGTTQHAIQVDVQHLPKGNYFIHYQSKGISKTKKLLKY